MNILKLFIFWISVTISIQAQNTINGNITDKRTHEPIPGVSVYINNTQIGTTTDLNGNYQLSNIDQYDVQVVFSFTGYLEQKLRIQFNTSLVTQNVTLEESVLELDEVILSTPFNKLQSENVVKVSHRSVSAMQRSGIQNFMDGIVQISGVTQISAGSGITKPVIRGLTGSRVLVYNQGVRLENFQFGELHGMGINESGIESVEIIKGPASLLYGSDAVGGVIYLVPESFTLAGETAINLHSKYISNTLGFSNTMGIKTSTDKLQLLARIALNTNADYAIPNADRVTNSRYNDRDFKAGIGYKNDKLIADIRYNYNQAKNGIPHDIGIQETTHEITGTHQGLDNHVLSVKNELNIKNSKIKTNIGHSWHKRTNVAEDITRIGMQLNTLNYDAKWYLPMKFKIESIIGVQGMAQTNENFGASYLLPDAKTQSLGFFTNLNYAYNKTSLQAGIRYDTRHIVTDDIGTSGMSTYRQGFDKNLSNFTSSLGIKTKPFKGVTARINLATGFRAPNLSELASKGIHEGRIEIGNANLKNEKNWQADIALEYENTHMEFFANAFVNTISNYIYIAPTGEIQEEYAIYQYEQDNAQLYGGEIGMHLHPHPLDWLHMESVFEMVIGKRGADAYLPLIPANQWKNQIRLTNNTRHATLNKYYLNIAFNHRFETTKISDFEDPQDSYSLVNTSFGSSFSFDKMSFDMTLSVHNIFNKEYVSHLSVLREYDIPNMGRNVIFGINFEL